ncbi:MAG: tRNA (N6-isopentenyl adenosine(37)-C2)-methylthiotransferase MiaB [Coriobacteriia bacterium]|nr:tRNA (N6-isopentenyl adenosine(37)-C2)-methylthiotransferase MiaB [Coriobacteriia bacterium]
MNKHDSERVAGMLEALGAQYDDKVESADIVVFMTCCVREAADVRLLGQVASLKCLERAPIIAVGGCIGQRDGAKLVEQLPHIDVVFGTHNIARLPALVFDALEQGTAQVEVLDDVGALERPASVEAATDLPSHREHNWHAWVPIMTGCNNFCSYCVVPYVRGREKSRPFEEVVEEARRLVAEGVVEITLLGQNVNSYGRDLYGSLRFAEMLRAVGAVGVERLRFATSHPKDLSPETIAAFAETPAVMPQLHLPAQSGSDVVLAAMNRGYTAEKYVGLVEAVRSACGGTGGLGKDVAFSTDLIVGFPGETEADFEATMDLVRTVGYSQAFTFIYSRREGTPAALLDDPTPREVIQERFDALVALVQDSAYTQNQKELGAVLPVLFEGASKRDSLVLSGRSPKNQTVHVELPSGAVVEDYAGRIREVVVEEARTWYLRGRLLAD